MDSWPEFFKNFDGRRRSAEAYERPRWEAKRGQILTVWKLVILWLQSQSLCICPLRLVFYHHDHCSTQTKLAKPRWLLLGLDIILENKKTLPSKTMAITVLIYNASLKYLSCLYLSYQYNYIISLDEFKNMNRSSSMGCIQLCWNS